MQLHQIQPKQKNKSGKRKGRGKKHGMYSGRGIKGQKARAGKKLQPAIRRFVKRYPKKRGYRFKSLKPKPDIVNLSQLGRVFQKDEEISPLTLVQKGILRKKRGKLPAVKILGKGEADKPFVIKECQISDTARAKLEKAGGRIIANTDQQND